ncbi:hypothetical protein C4D39_15835 [Clostridium perfringens]
MYLLVVFQGSIFFKNNSDYFYILVLIISLLLLLFRPRIFSGRFILYILGLFLLLFFVSIYSSGSLSIASILNIISRFLLVNIAYKFNKKNSLTIYIKTVIFLSIISLVGFIIQIINSNILKGLLLECEPGYYGILFYTWSEVWHPTRNIGILAEPGLYIIILNVALFILLFYSDRINLSSKKQVKYIIIIILTIFTAQSTMGYICAAGILILGMLEGTNKDLNKYKKYLIIFIFIIICIDIVRGEQGFIYNNLIMKITNSSKGLDLSVSSGKSRIVSMQADILIAKDYPLGSGFSNYELIWKYYLPEYIPDLSSCVGLTKSLATIGIPATIYILSIFIYKIINKNKTLYCKIACLFLFICITFSQPQILFPALMFIFFLE